MESFGGDDGADDIATIGSDLISSMNNIVPENSLLSTKCCIFATPKLLLKDNEKSYLPTAFAIGPVHHGKPDLQEAEQIKLKYTRDLIARVSEWNDTIVKDLVKEIASLEEQARQYYAVPVKFNKAKFVKLLLVDGCFIIELFRKRLGDSPIYEDDPVCGRPFLREVLGTDLLLLENQIPWMVLDRLFSSTTRTGALSLTQVTLSFFSFLRTGGLDLQTENSFMLSTLDQSKHVLELLRNSLVWSTIPEGGELDTWELIPSASSLTEAGVKFKKGSTSNGLLDIKFSNGVLEIPPLVIVEPTKAFFRNLISYEQCYHWCHPKITSYAMLLDLLINTSKDMDILCENGIIQNWLNPEDATQIFNNLYNDTNVSHFYYLELCREVNKYCKRRWPRWRAMYVRNHFSSPWAIASQVLAAIIFILTLLQTVFSIKS
ncbi:hypothetical protein RchiOBHm_Chr6g0269291 [Rosa chinensis]|uniref:Uncharacterized protein n=1 Tax=Rosa chinensis TaxID=74649 RepID=A0A2P6PQH7_ROSCH|nr:UPF0481 protein At3g47200 [Rosa chinensis]XP_024166586.1 UPF0481 protein At3g47200 [Rosa chinensis]PRQ24156.1 hypothetical protein RchiOBHm_Chr6g0269291 [Rosa chinensis]